MNNSKKRDTFLTVGEYELVLAAVEKYPCEYDKRHTFHKEKM